MAAPRSPGTTERSGWSTTRSLARWSRQSHGAGRVASPWPLPRKSSRVRRTAAPPKRRCGEEAWARAGLRLPPDTPVLGMDDPWRYRIRGEFEAISRSGQWGFGFHRLRSHSVMPIDACLIHDLRIEPALPAFAQAATELQLKDLQNLQLTVEPTGKGLLWRLRPRGPVPTWPRDGFAHRVAAR